jgi:hypothetical protein
MRLDPEHICRERRFYHVEIVQPKGPVFLPPFVRMLLGDHFPIKGEYTKEGAKEKASELRDLYRRNPNNKRIVRVKNIFG